MTSKVLVKLPTVPFPQGKKSSPDLVTLTTKNEGPAPTTIRAHQTVTGDRTAQLEQNMKFLQEQHQATLVALHQEVETLRQRNRDLQFQLVFGKSTNSVQSTPSSPEENSIGFVKTKGSPLGVNVTPLQVELLEKDLDEIKVSFNKVEKHNQYLLEVIDKQNKKLQQSEKRKEKWETTDVGIQSDETTDSVHEDLTARLEDAEAIVKRLRRENEDHQREIATMKASSSSSSSTTTTTVNSGYRNGSGRSRGHDNGHHNRGSQGGGGSGSHYHKFPPLQTQSYWHGGARGNHRQRADSLIDLKKNGFYDQNADYPRNGRRRQDEHQDRETIVDGTVLPQLRNSNSKPDSSSFPPFYRSRGYHDEGGDYYRPRVIPSNRKFRVPRSHRDGDSHENRRDYKESKDQQRKDATTNGTQPSRKQ